MYDTEALEPEPRGGVAPEHAAILVRRADARDEPLVGEDERRGRRDAHAERLVERLEHALLGRGGGERGLELPDVEPGADASLGDEAPGRERVFVEHERDRLGGGDAGRHAPIVAAGSLPGRGTDARLAGCSA